MPFGYGEKVRAEIRVNMFSAGRRESLAVALPVYLAALGPTKQSTHSGLPGRASGTSSREVSNPPFKFMFMVSFRLHVLPVEVLDRLNISNWYLVDGSDQKNQRSCWLRPWCCSCKGRCLL